MGVGTRTGVWDGIINMPLPTRLQKPRNTGLTMVMDKGLGLNETSELLSVSGDYIDFIKLAFGTPFLYSEELLRSKIKTIRDNKIHVYPGGTFLEIAVTQNKVEAFLDTARELGFSAIEVSDGTIRMSSHTRREVIKQALQFGFTVISEVGKKDPCDNLSVGSTVDQVNFDLDAGVSKVILEARESGKGIGIFNNNGEIMKDQFDDLLRGLPDHNLIIWETPLKGQQQELILKFGSNVNLGNIPPSEVLALESLRVGLRGDTLKAALNLTGVGDVR